MVTEPNKIIALFIKYPDYFIKLVSENYPFEIDLLKKYENLLDWNKISTNEAIIWDAEIIKTFIERWNWRHLSSNPAAFKDFRLIEVFRDNILWQDPEPYYFTTLANNTGINWSIELIEKYEHLWDYDQMSSNETIPWKESLIDKHIKEWEWGVLAYNKSLPWSIDFIEKYKPFLGKDNFWFTINPLLTGSIPIIEKYGHELSWFAICSNSCLPWAEEDLLIRWKDKIDWNGISENELLMSNPIFFEDNLDKWLLNNGKAFTMLSKNKALNWSKSFIDRFIDYWDWESLRENEGLPWSIKFIAYYSEKWDWGGYIPDFIYYDDNGNTLDNPIPIKEVVNGLIDNKALPWSIEFINHFEKDLDFERLLDNSIVWEKAFKPYVDTKMIEIVCRII